MTENTSLSRKPATQGLVKAAVWILLLYGLTQLATWYFFDLTVWAGVLWRDALIHVVVGCLLYLLCRRFVPWALAWTLTISVLQISNGLKYAVLGSPVMPDDFVGFVNMFRLFDDWRLFAMWAALLLPVLMWIYAIDWLRLRTWVLLALLGGAGFAFASFPTAVNAFMDAHFGDRIWDQPGNYRDRGLIHHVLQETSRNLARGDVVLSEAQVHDALDAVAGGRRPDSADPVLEQRNVYIILLESFFDPMALTAAGISEDPLDPRFRALWAESGHSTGLAPVFGGYTANSEFEILCGFPVTHDAVFFEGWLRNRVPCLPDQLARAGFRTIASHPNSAAFWNRVFAYDRLGFSDYWSVNDFALDDMNGPFLSDASLYRQLDEKQAPMRAAGTPLLSYIVTYFGHMDYPLNEARPSPVRVQNDPNLVERYVNTLYYKSRELMDYYDKLRREDPQAVILVFGDHLPFLGPNFDGFVESGLLERDKGQFTPAMFRTYSETPMIFTDGDNGVLNTGHIPMYQAPGIIMALLGDQRDSLLNLLEPDENTILRPLPGMTLAIDRFSAEPLVCVDGAEEGACAAINTRVSHIKTLTSDIFSGEQLALP
ncbi:LTA synthase family protein [Granulosicoccaceae sp. 1_MG-2023]|nr:LTA synthase family protein [Granulosicoccaceae sp. 1_MG-2023]